jgi:hypothetical protein
MQIYKRAKVDYESSVTIYNETISGCNSQSNLNDYQDIETIKILILDLIGLPSVFTKWL